MARHLVEGAKERCLEDRETPRLGSGPAALGILNLIDIDSAIGVKSRSIAPTCSCIRVVVVTKQHATISRLDYKTPDGAALRSPAGRKYDAVIHCTTGIPWSIFEPNLSGNGMVIDLTPSVSTMMTFALKIFTCSKKRIVPLLYSPKGENLEYLVKLVKEGKLKTVVDSKYPLSKAEDAWAKSIDGHATGKIVVEQ
ncbi:chloroplast envelope quinone oxidoreductase homolog [Rhododendron vialii]|uniref:chloroplast envelope quinone oxidoreductase homolog n=1 Tax=Rhododendron vialii TaxID=182163 RepID=UPI00265E979E|nr:chloroplast envelope quinone oxidoreductase homolog [Rhododendron vialii]